ncbi:hypothetical protein HPB50_006514 [Hyalomma asiaticum]|uniref:Uncharacterized protein n=1 Tax=Hyalomma asiaticum TaxID=266040 RepID=A0ACB7SW32_HYAAI|nr:hypothetical protein HPB50_006514 [Hyalomma asiaticum]
MSGESSFAFLHKISSRRSAPSISMSKGTAAATFTATSLLGVCGIATVLTLIVRELGADATDDTMSTVGNISAIPVSSHRREPAPPRKAPDELHVHPKRSASLSADKIRSIVQKRRGEKASTTTSRNGASDSWVPNGTSVYKKAPDLASHEGYHGTNDFNVSDEHDSGTVADGWSDLDVNQSSLGQVSRSSSLQQSSTRQFSTAERTNTAASTRAFSFYSKSMEPQTKTSSGTRTSSSMHLDGHTVDVEATTDAARKSRASSGLLFCFYDDRSSIRSPGFSVYDFPVQLCTDVAFCCVGVNAKGQVVVSKKLKLFLEVIGHEFLPPRHLFVTLGGHRLLLHHLDAALGNTAVFATDLSEDLRRMGAGGLAVYIEDVERLKHAVRVHDLLMAVRGVSVAVVLPRDLRQQVRYYRTEIYANTKDMLVVSPPSQGYGGRQPQPGFATCPHPRRSVYEGSSLEFIYHLSRTLLSSMADDAMDYASGGGASTDEQTPVPRCLIGVSLGGLKFQLKNRSHHDVGSPATFVRTVPYREICKQGWHQWHDNVSECYVAWDGDRGWMSSLGPQSTGFTTEMAHGLAVFDLDFDDYAGECGNKFPVLRALRSALTA